MIGTGENTCGTLQTISDGFNMFLFVCLLLNILQWTMMFIMVCSKGLVSWLAIFVFELN